MGWRGFSSINKFECETQSNVRKRKMIFIPCEYLNYIYDFSRKKIKTKREDYLTPIMIKFRSREFKTDPSHVK